MGVGEVSVRELRQNLSVYLQRVRRGDTLAVTSRGERVAVLVPIGGGSRLDRLVADGRVSGPDLPWVEPDPVSLDADPATRSLTQVLLDQRAQDQR